MRLSASEITDVFEHPHGVDFRAVDLTWEPGSHTEQAIKEAVIDDMDTKEYIELASYSFEGLVEDLIEEVGTEKAVAMVAGEMNLDDYKKYTNSTDQEILYEIFDNAHIDDIRKWLKEIGYSIRLMKGWA